MLKNKTLKVVDSKKETKEPQKISVKVLIAGFKATRSKGAEDYVAEHLSFENYLPYIKKVTLADQIVNQTFFEHIDGKPTGKIRMNSPLRALLMYRAMIETHTNLRFDKENAVGDFDELIKEGLFSPIMSMISEDEISEFESLVQMTVKDYTDNYYEPRGYWGRTLEQFKEILGELAERYSKNEKAIDSSPEQK